ncbi:MAG: aconitate hydratase AcnA, partial [Gemmatimonadetes bacterium]|nr:aconitate hydratase AcnA [Gemmatimonadota bacterium]NIR74398.1 aconitate hydratase AcnA [Candidatus Kutchimonas denitrificans]NIS02649.1 aconitate hydratase AcnA [Gemmatimonadota bacterium]NIT68524.1 aconitate hydratase AcnA [Gemmatimonadota bacterium]NIU52001.1 aconitate hydratase AcnA [Gemmatimonadota bacterium]
MADSFGTHGTLDIGGTSYRIARLGALEKEGLEVGHLPYALRVLLENLLRFEDGSTVPASDIEALARWQLEAGTSTEIAYRPARVLLQDFTGVPAVVDLAAMRDALRRLGGDPGKINPLQPAELVIDHSVQVDFFGSPEAFRKNAEREFERNRERYAFLRWGQQALENFRVVPPATGIVHQVNLEYLARVVMDDDDGWAYPDTLVGTDSHTTMINGLGVLGWGVGGIEAEAAMLGQPVTMLIPDVIGFKLTGQLPEGATATDLVLRVTEMLRRKGVVGKFVEFYGAGLAKLPLADRATISNMSPEMGCTSAIFPVDDETLNYLRFTGRSEERIALVEAYMKEQGLFHTVDSPEAKYTDTLELDLGTVEPSLAGPKRPQDRVPLSRAKVEFKRTLAELLTPGAGRDPEVGRWENEGGEAKAAPDPVDQLIEESAVPVSLNGDGFDLRHGSVVIAAITSCTNTSNPSVMVAAGLVAKKAVERGLGTKPWVKTSLAPGSKVVTDYLENAGLTAYLNQLRFNLVGYGCTTCIGNSGPLHEKISAGIEDGDLVAVSVLSGNRNFEGRVHSEVRANYLASPPLVVAYALAGRMDIDIYRESLGTGDDGEPVYLEDIWPTRQEVHETIGAALQSDMFRKSYAEVFEGSEEWKSMPVPQGDLYEWDPDSTYVKHPPFFEGLTVETPPVEPIEDARVLVYLGDSVTTDHISPAGAIKKDSPAGRYLIEHGVEPRDFNSYGSRRGNHEVMMRGTFANVRLRNKLVPGVEGGYTRHLTSGEEMSIYDAAMKYMEEGTPLIVLAGKEYGSGSSRDWAAKGTRLLGIRAVIAESYERIHRSNLIGMGVLPLQFAEGESAESLGLDGEETFTIESPEGKREVEVTAVRPDGEGIEFTARVRIDTPQEFEYYRNGGILHYVLR